MASGIRVRSSGKRAYYSVAWSALVKADRWKIAKCVPAVGGVFEIYWMDERKHLRLMTVASARFGGLRSEIRRLTDPELVEDSRTAAILEDKDIYFRYAESDSVAAMADVVWFFRKTYFPENPGVSHSGRYEVVFAEETAPDRVRWVE
jgi:hypothetical protein